ncbi:MAG TPA: fatty acid--CoA ligase, partial [Hyphomonas sp.]|nr:fatty acid--CoA ligase [Hyphomonas sp.]
MSIAQANEMLAAEGSPLELMDAVINGVEMKIYKNAPPTIPLVLQLASMQYADRDFIVYEDERVTFDALARAVV